MSLIKPEETSELTFALKELLEIVHFGKINLEKLE